jgi:YHS domain-containing protein
VTSAHFEWNYTTFLNILFILLAVAVYWLSKNKKRFGGGEGYAIDPACGMQVRMSDAPATAVIAGTTYYFCSDRCHERYTSGAKHEPTCKSLTPVGAATATAVDPVCGMTVDTTDAAAIRNHDGVTYFFCSSGCATTFDTNPDPYIHHEVKR